MVGDMDTKTKKLLTCLHLIKNGIKEHANDIYGMCFPKKLKYYTYAYEKEKNW